MSFSAETSYPEDVRGGRHFTTSGNLQPANDLATYLRCYAQEKPEVVALWCFGIGFILGWKLKPW